MHEDTTRLERGILARLAPGDWQDLVMLAARQRVLPLLYQRMRILPEAEQPAAVLLQPLKEHYRRNAVTVLRFQKELGAIVRMFDTAGIPTLVLKGMSLASLVYQNVALREMNDIDIMVPRERLHDGEHMLAALGYGRLKPGSVETDTAFSQHLGRFANAANVSVELHWNITRPGRHYSIDPAELWQRAVPLHLDDCAAWTLSPEDLLLHLCFHTSFQHRFIFGLRPSCDITRMIIHAGDALDWNTVVQQAYAWGGAPRRLSRATRSTGTGGRDGARPCIQGIEP